MKKKKILRKNEKKKKIHVFLVLSSHNVWCLSLLQEL